MSPQWGCGDIWAYFKWFKEPERYLWALTFFRDGEVNGWGFSNHRPRVQVVSFSLPTAQSRQKCLTTLQAPATDCNDQKTTNTLSPLRSIFCQQHTQIYHCIAISIHLRIVSRSHIDLTSCSALVHHQYGWPKWTKSAKGSTYEKFHVRKHTRIKSVVHKTIRVSKVSCIKWYAYQKFRV